MHFSLPKTLIVDHPYRPGSQCSGPTKDESWNPPRAYPTSSALHPARRNVSDRHRTCHSTPAHTADDYLPAAGIADDPMTASSSSFFLSMTLSLISRSAAMRWSPPRRRAFDVVDVVGSGSNSHEEVAERGAAEGVGPAAGTEDENVAMRQSPSTFAPQRTEIWLAFLKTPFLRLQKQTWRVA